MPYRLIPRRLRERIGRRGLVLLLFGCAWLVQGLANFLIGPLGSGGFMHDRMPVVVQGAFWLATGGLGVIAALTHKGKSDTFGFMAITAMPMWLGISYLLGAITFGLEGVYPQWLIGLLGVSVWGILAMALSVVASWPEEGSGSDE